MTNCNSLTLVIKSLNFSKKKIWLRIKKWDLRCGHVDGSDGAALADSVICINVICDLH